MSSSSSNPVAAAAAHQQIQEQQYQPTLRQKIGTMVTPGDRLGLVARGKTELVPGSGTYIRQGNIYASMFGTLRARRQQHHPTNNVNNNDNIPY